MRERERERMLVVINRARYGYPGFAKIDKKMSQSLVRHQIRP